MYMLIKQCFFLLSVVTLCCFRPVICLTQSLDPDEKAVLKQMAATMGAKSMNLTVDPCQSQRLMITAGQPNNDQEVNNATCSCSIGNFCHITNLNLKSLSLPGRLPIELVNLTFLETIDLTCNYLNGTLPIEWATMRNLKNISLTANRLFGEIPKEWGSLTSLTYLSLEANQLSGTIPWELGNLLNLTDLVLSSNQFVGSLPFTLANLKNLINFRISDNSFNGPVPEFIGRWAKLNMLEMHASGLKGPIPAAIFHLEKLNDLRITDMKGTEFDFPKLTSKVMKNLVLRNLNLSGSIPEDIWAMKLKMLDVSFNKLGGEIQTSADSPPKYGFLSGNMLTGKVPESFLSSKKNLDLSYNNFTLSSSCPESREINMNMYKSASWKNNSGLTLCLNGSKCQTYYRSIHINCGGPNVHITNKYGKILYEGDDGATVGGAFHYNRGTNWGLISTGDFMHDDEENRYGYTLKNSSKLLGNYSELYTTARVTPMFLTYYGYCLINGIYTVNLHFAELLFRDGETYSSLGRRIFDIYIQGKLVQKDFNIKDEANGTNKDVTREFKATVTENTLEIRLYWAGKGTTCIPKRGNYGALISAISVCLGKLLIYIDEGSNYTWCKD